MQLYQMSIGLFLSFVTTAAAFDDEAIIAACDEKWGQDFRMVKYCRDQQRTSGTQVDLLRSRAQSDLTTRTILGECVSKWSTDYRMVMDCHAQQISALSDLSEKPGDIPVNVFDAIERNCVGKWGTDFRMVAYCQNQQFEAWREIQ